MFTWMFLVCSWIEHVDVVHLCVFYQAVGLGFCHLRQETSVDDKNLGYVFPVRVTLPPPPLQKTKATVTTKWGFDTYKGSPCIVLVTLFFGSTMLFRQKNAQKGVGVSLLSVWQHTVHAVHILRVTISYQIWSHTKYEIWACSLLRLLWTIAYVQQAGLCLHETPQFFWVCARQSHSCFALCSLACPIL